jgi:hypothetical protein
MSNKLSPILTKGRSLLIITLLIAAYYLVCGIYLNHIGYYDQERLFYAEKIKIIFEGSGYKLKIMGLTAPILPFFVTILFSKINVLLAPVIASALGTAFLFYLMADTLTKFADDDLYLYALIAVFLLHPGILYVACSGKAIYMVLIFFFMFFLNIFKFYHSNTTFHISIASICLVMLLFCDYKFIWLTLFFIPLIFSIALKSLNLSEKESIFRMTLSFNNPSLRRKLINRTFALYIILFILPIASIICYKILNLTNAADTDYFINSPYANWSVLMERMAYQNSALDTTFTTPEISLLISARMILFCPLILFAIYLFRNNPYQILTLLTPFAFVEFLHVKYNKTFLSYQYYLIFFILALLCLIIKSRESKTSVLFKIALGLLLLLQIYTGYYFLDRSLIDAERNFMALLKPNAIDKDQDENHDIAKYINNLPLGEKVLMDDAIAYPIAAFTNNIAHLTLPYQDNYLSAIETPNKYVTYILIANPKNPLSGYTLLNTRYTPVSRQLTTNSSNLQKAYETDNWTLYRLY